MAGMADYINYAQNAGFSGDALRTMAAIAWAESKGNTNAYNPKYGATGINQITPATWQDFGQRFGYNNIYDPQQNFNAAYNIYSGNPYGGGFGKWEPYTVPESHPNHYGRYLPMVDAELARRGGNQPQAQAKPIQQPQVSNAVRVPGIDKPFTPPRGTAADWTFDQASGRMYNRADQGKNWNDIEFYHIANGDWARYQNPGQSQTRGKLLFGDPSESQRNQLNSSPMSGVDRQSRMSQSQSNSLLDRIYGPPDLDSFYTPTQKPQGMSQAESYSLLDSIYAGSTPKPQSQRQPFYQGGMEGAERALGPGGMTWAQEAAQRQNNTFGRMPPQASGLFGGGMRMPQMPPPNMLPNGLMGFGPGRPQLPVTPIGNTGMVNYQGAGYTPNGLRLSQMQSGLF